MIRVGTCGFSYDDWVGPFYPEGTRHEDMLTRYAQSFNCLELNVTFYAPLSRESGRTLVKRSEGRLVFAIKAPRTLTHDLKPEGWEAFRKSLEPFEEASVLGCVLLQFPFSFRNDRGNRSYLSRFSEWTTPTPLVVEFRHKSWVKKEVLDWLRGLRLGFCCVDEPSLEGLMPRASEVTTEVGYLRFHGRNESKWWHHKESWERYDYLYDEEELKAWVPSVKQMNAKAQNMFVFFNNHSSGQATQNALLFNRLIEPHQGAD